MTRHLLVVLLSFAMVAGCWLVLRVRAAALQKRHRPFPW